MRLVCWPLKREFANYYWPGLLVQPWTQCWLADLQGCCCNVTFPIIHLTIWFLMQWLAWSELWVFEGSTAFLLVCNALYYLKGSTERFRCFQPWPNKGPETKQSQEQMPRTGSLRGLGHQTGQLWRSKNLGNQIGQRLRPFHIASSWTTLSGWIMSRQLKGPPEGHKPLLPEYIQSSRLPWKKDRTR